MNQEEEAAAASLSSLSSLSPSHPFSSDLESRRVAAGDKLADLVASPGRVVHVNNRDDELPPSSATSIRPAPALSPIQQLPIFQQQQQYVVPSIDGQSHLQISQITASPNLEPPTITPVPGSLGFPAVDNAQLTEPYNSNPPPHALESEERSLGPIDQLPIPAPIIATRPQLSLRTSHDIPLVPPSAEANIDGASAALSEHRSEMLLGEPQKSSAVAHRRHSMAMTSALTDYEADLTSKDRMKQKDAIRKILASKVKDDWSWVWPRQSGDPGTPIVNRSRESLAEEDWKEREEWISNASESDGEGSATVASPSTLSGGSNGKDPFRFNSPDEVGDTLRKTAEARKARRRRRLQEEMRTNDGLSCFIHRRNAWTCARHVNHTRPPPSTSAPLKRTFSRSRATSKPSPTPLPPLAQTQGDDSFEITTEIPIAPPILPPETPMRKGINERAYATIYDKIILQSQTPFCPINLSVVTRSCVEGWKRDGEWPPKPGDVDTVTSGLKKAGLGPDAADGRLDRREARGKGRGVLRRGLQKVMGAVRERAGSKDKEEPKSVTSGQQ